MRDADYDTVKVLRSKVLFRPDHRAAILLEGHRRANEPYSVAFEVDMQAIGILRTELDRAAAFLSGVAGSA